MVKRLTTPKGRKNGPREKGKGSLAGGASLSLSSASAFTNATVTQRVYPASIYAAADCDGDGDALPAELDQGQEEVLSREIEG